METTLRPDLRARIHDVTLAALTTAYPDEQCAAVLGTLSDSLTGHPGIGPLLGRLADGLDTLRGEYTSVFDHGRDRVALYETEYGRMRGLSKGNDLADILGFYQAFGFDMDSSCGVEMPDHLAVELEFYGVLLYKEAHQVAVGDVVGEEIIRDARRKFLVSHLGGFVGAIAARPGVQSHPTYGPLLAWCAEVVARECRVAEVTPAPLDFFAESDAEEPANCGGSVEIPGLEGEGGGLVQLPSGRRWPSPPPAG